MQKISPWLGESSISWLKGPRRPARDPQKVPSKTLNGPIRFSLPLLITPGRLSLLPCARDSVAESLAVEGLSHPTCLAYRWSRLWEYLSLEQLLALSRWCLLETVSIRVSCERASPQPVGSTVITHPCRLGPSGKTALCRCDIPNVLLSWDEAMSRDGV